MFSSAGCRLNHFGGRTSLKFATRLGRLSPNWNNSAITRRSEPLAHCETARTTLCAASYSLIPFNSNSPTGSTFTASSTATSTRGLIGFVPASPRRPGLRVISDILSARQARRLGSCSGRFAVAERSAVPRKPGNAGGGKGPQFKTNARRGEGPGDWATYPRSGVARAASTTGWPARRCLSVAR